MMRFSHKLDAELFQPVWAAISATAVAQSLRSVALMRAGGGALVRDGWLPLTVSRAPVGSSSAKITRGRGGQGPRLTERRAELRLSGCIT